MANGVKPTTFLESFRILKGNTRISVLFEPLWGIPYALYSFYLGLYMKGRGITDEQIGYLISIGFIAGIIFSMLSGYFTNALGRRRTTLIFDLFCWPVATAIYFVSNCFWMFAMAQVVNATVKIVSVAWNLMVVEDADAEQQVVAYNWLNVVNIAAGIFTPLAGIMVKQYGIIGGERILLGFAALSTLTMILVRNYYYRETRVGQQILSERRTETAAKIQSGNPGFWKTLQARPLIVPALLFAILFNAYIPIGTYSSLYYGPYLTEVLKLDKAAIALLGGINAGVLVLVFLFLVPLFSRLNHSRLMIGGIGAQIMALVLLMLIPAGGFAGAVAVTILFALGYGIAKPFIDSVLAGATVGKERAGIYAVYNVGISSCGAVFGLVSGYLYRQNPNTIYLISIAILVLCIVCLNWLESWEARGRAPSGAPEE